MPLVAKIVTETRSFPIGFCIVVGKSSVQNFDEIHQGVQELSLGNKNSIKNAPSGKNCDRNSMIFDRLLYHDGTKQSAKF